MQRFLNIATSVAGQWEATTDAERRAMPSNLAHALALFRLALLDLTDAELDTGRP